MNRVCRFTIPASRDIEGILDYAAAEGDFDAAEQLLNRINQKCDRLLNFPGMGRRRDELALGLRSFPIDRFLIFYIELENGIEVARVISGYQDIESLFAEPE